MSRFPSRLMVYIAGLGVPQYLGIIQALLRQEESIESVDFIVGDRLQFRWAQTQVVDPRIRFSYQHERLKPFLDGGTLNEHQLAQLEARYGLPNLWRYVQAQRIIEHLSERRKLWYVQSYLDYFESLYRSAKPEVLITGMPDSLPFMVACEVCKRSGCLTISMAPGRLPGRFFIVENELEQIRGLHKAYEQLKTRPLTVSELETVQSLRKAYTERKIRPSYYRVRPKLTLIPSIFRLISYLRRRIIGDDRYFDYPLSVILKRSILFRARPLLQDRALNQNITSLIPHKKFFYMPLNYEPESGLDVQNSFYRDQISMLSRVVSGLPAGYAVYVKEHPNMLPGARRLGFYQRLVSLGDVYLLPREMDSYEIVRQCAGVVTIGGTTGIEALFCGKPVLLFGHAFYESFQEGVFRVNGFEDIAIGLKKMADMPSVDQELFGKFVTAVLVRSYPGSFELTSPNALDPTTYETIARGVGQEIRSQLCSA